MGTELPLYAYFPEKRLIGTARIEGNQLIGAVTDARAKSMISANSDEWAVSIDPTTEACLIRSPRFLE